MPWYEINGFGRNTGRKRKRTFFAETKDLAIDLAAKDEVVVDTVTEVEPPPPIHYFTKVAGVSHGNRQKIIRQCTLWELLLLDSEEDNKKDPNAIRVIRANGQQLGYISAEFAPEISKKARSGYSFGVYIAGLTGGEPGKPTRGVNLLIVELPPGRTQSEATTYLKELIASGEFSDRDAPPRVYDPADVAPNTKQKSGTGCMTVILFFILLGSCTACAFALQNFSLPILSVRW